MIFYLCLLFVISDTSCPCLYEWTNLFLVTLRNKTNFLMRLLCLFFLSFRVFRLLSSSLLLFPQRFCRYTPRPSSGICQTREPARNFELRPLLNPRGSSVLIPFVITRYKCLVFLYCYSPAIRFEPATSRILSPYNRREPTPITVTLCVLLFLFLSQVHSLR